MTDKDLATLAKAGDRTAVNELLRRATPEVRSIVRSLLLRLRKTFDVFEDATAEAVCSLWRSLPAWDPERGPLIGFARTNIERAVLRHVADMGHAVAIPDKQAQRETYRQARGNCLKRASSTEADLTPFGDPIGDTIPADGAPDPEAQHDAARLLGALSSSDADLLWRVACGEMLIEALPDSSKAAAHASYRRAMERAQRSVNVCFRRAA